MKLRNKKTGEIIERYIIETASAIGVGLILQDNDTNKHYQYNSIAEFCEEWEDYEEPKEYWYLSGRGEVRCIEDDGVKFDKDHKEIGNYFETKEEAEKAVEKLKAWKRLKDKGFRFSHHSFLDRRISYKVPMADEKIGKDLDLLFGGEE